MSNSVNSTLREDLEKSIEDLKCQLQVKTVELSTQMENADSLRRNVENLQDLLQNSESGKFELQKTLEDATSKLAAATLQTAVVVKEKTRLEAVIDELHSERRDFVQQCVEMNQDTAVLQQKIEELKFLQKDRKLLKAQVEQHVAQISSLESDKQKQSDLISGLEQKLDDFRKSKSEYQLLLDESNARIVQLTLDLQAASIAKEDEQAELFQLREIVEELEKSQHRSGVEAKELQEAYDKIEDDLKSAQAQIAELSTERSNLLIKSESLDAQIKELQNDKSLLKNEFEGASFLIEDLQKEQQGKEDEISKLRSDLENSESRYVQILEQKEVLAEKVVVVEQQLER